MDVCEHYNRLIDEDNDPFRDPPALKKYMEGWDGEIFFRLLAPKKEDAILEIGIGTGRLAAKVLPLCKALWGIDLSPKSVERARENLASHPNLTLVCGDFLISDLPKSFDMIYTSLTTMHIKEKDAFYEKVWDTLSPGGRFVLSIDKDMRKELTMGAYSLPLYPDDPNMTEKRLHSAGLTITEKIEVPFAHVFHCIKSKPPRCKTNLGGKQTSSVYELSFLF